MKLRKRIPSLRLYRKLRYRKGYGIHSPFVYSFITKVVEEKTPFYIFDEIEALRKIARHAPHRNYGALLFRIVNFFRCRSVLHIGDFDGILSLYLAMASPRHCGCYVWTDRQTVPPAVSHFALAHPLQNLHWLRGNPEKALQTVPSPVDLLFINRLPEGINVETCIALCRQLVHAKTILVLNAIAKDPVMKSLWQQCKNHPQAKAAIDLYALGIVFFDDNLPKKQYKTYFNYGKKSYLYKNRRRRFHFFSRRKKGLKNASAH
ncbi:MAG: hypothetical protein LBN18_06825 [Dysgonamonadaceae bacterium]|jgi:hypothetical protein|nr:hypothetical protein [Dysgonamonadaceae bacterium]